MAGTTVKETLPIAVFLTHVCYEVRLVAYSTHWPPTWFRAWMRAHGRLDGSPDLQDAVHAQQIVDWLREQQPNTQYMRDAQRCLHTLVLRREAPLIASLIQTHQWHLKQHNAQERVHRFSSSKHFGQLNERLTLEVTVIGIERTFLGGQVWFFSDEHGNVAKWFPSTSLPCKPVNHKLWIRGRVTEHRVEHGLNVTRLKYVILDATPLRHSPLRSAGR